MSRVAIVIDNAPEFVEILLQVWNQGDSAVIVDHKIPSLKLIEFLKETGAVKCYTDSNHFEPLKNALNIEVIEIRKSNSIIELNAKAYDNFVINYSTKEALVLFSSGTTGKNKGVILSHYAIQTNADRIIKYMQPTSSDIMYIVKSLAHSSTIVGELLVALKVRMHLYLPSTLMSPKQVLENIQQTRSTILCLNPSLLKLYTIQHNKKPIKMPYLKKIYVSGSIIEHSKLDEARRSFNGTKIYNVYGLTEAGPRVSAQTDENYGVENTVGKPLYNVEVKIVNDKFEELENGSIGSIIVKTDTKFTSYINTNKNDLKVLDGYIITGDIGYKDHADNLFIIGRNDDMIIRGSHNIFPNSIEEIVTSHPEVLDCIVFGIKDELFGEKIICMYSSKHADCNLKEYCRTSLAAYEIPDIFLCVKNIPYTCNHKKSRKEAELFYISTLK